jgi:hypothetical protein
MGGWALSFFFPLRGLWNAPSTSLLISCRCRKYLLLSERTPGWILGLLLHKSHEVKVLIVLVRLRTGIT